MTVSEESPWPVLRLTDFYLICPGIVKRQLSALPVRVAAHPWATRKRSKRGKGEAGHPLGVVARADRARSADQREVRLHLKFLRYSRSGGVLFGKPVRRNRGGWGAAEAAQDLDVRPAGPLARLVRPPDVADLL
jgi:hypothetical protein